MLDAILYHAWFWVHAPHVFEGLGRGKVPGEGYIGLPLRQIRVNGRNRYAASRAVYSQECVEIENWNKRPDFFSADKQQYLSAKSGVISSSVGLMRAYRMPQVVRKIKDNRLTFYAMGNSDEVQRLLNCIPAVGKKAAMGWGAVEKWEVMPASDDYTILHPQHGLMRHMPTDEITLCGYPIMEYGVKPPYWKRENHALCYVPIVPAEGL